MHEKRLISNRLIDAYGYGAVILSEDENISIMINESDHLVEQCSLSGLNLISAYDRLNAIDNQILSNLDIAYDDSIGFLTSNISDVGTGMRASISLFLPALTLSGKLREIISSVSNQGIEISSLGEDELDSRAYTYIVSNSFTIGKKETDYVVRVTECVIKICEMEIRARTELLSAQNIDDVKDKVNRAWGILTNCFKIGVGEAHKLLGELKMGVALDLVRFKEVDFLDKLMIDVEPYSLTKISGSKVADSDLDKYRATFLANVLKSKRIK
jgi:protein arginine kinase